VGLISAAFARRQPRAAGRHPSLMPISSRALRRCKGFLPDRPSGPRRFDRRASSATTINLLAMFVGHPLSHALLCGTRCPHGHPPLSLEAAFGGLLFFQPGRLWRPPFLSAGPPLAASFSFSRAAFGGRSFWQAVELASASALASPTSPRPSPPPRAERESKGGAFALSALQGGEGGDPARSAGEGEVGPIGSAAAPPRSRHRRYRSRCRRPVLARPSDAAPWRRCRAPDNCGRTPADCRGRPAPAAAGDRCSAGCGLREIPEREAVVHLPYSGKPTNRPFVPCPVFQKVRLS
jgi:hypothetical protein